VLICVVLVFSYYSLLSLGVFLAEDAVIAASLAMWMPNLAFGLIAIPLLYRARRAEI
jgi:lipopolysaccharide export LptBFGC system permease protein LptF